ncbi:amidohydrolase [Govanella unica]|uniref:Amidohydrolase n=1 Tax=Govanella unica TaxID=2975056 RepID=A0A9X3U021_9PROT|nr:amidohydrolase [Govania unica]MDA5195141.1 amidohydrolase [Govania unica]
MRLRDFKRYPSVSLPVILACLLTASPAVSASGDLALINGDVKTPKGWSQAVGISNGKIIAVGTSADVQKALGKDAKVIDLMGKTVVPGMHDMHAHPMMAGILLSSCTFEQGSDLAAMKKAISDCAKKKKPGEWISGGQWQAGSLKDSELNKETLDAIAPDNPVSLVDISGHSLWVNSRALALAGITKDTKNPEGGIIERDAKGEATGILRESARDVLRKVLPKAGLAENTAALKTALDIMTSFGITTVVDAMVTPESLAAYVHLAETTGIEPRVRGCYVWRDNNPDFERDVANRTSFTRVNFKLDCVKVFMDGVPTDSHTGAMLEPYDHYENMDPKKPARGLLLAQADELNPLVTRLDKAGVTVKFHAAGDWAVRSAFDAVEAARKANGLKGPLHDVGHLTFVSEQDIKRAKPLNATLEFSPYLWFPQPITKDIIKVTGAKRNERAWPVAEGVKSGALVVAGSDWYVIPTPNPWIAVETLVTRKAPGGKGEAYGPKEAITLDDAMIIFTSNGARQFGNAAASGTIETGKIADLAIIDRNPYKIPITDVHNIKNLYTIIDGKIIYDASQAK